MIQFADLECDFLTCIMPYNLLAVTNAWRTLLLLLLLYYKFLDKACKWLQE